MGITSKPKLSINDQVKHLESKGIQFNISSQGEAVRF